MHVLKQYVKMPEDLSVRETDSEVKSKGLSVYESCWLSEEDNQRILEAVTMPFSLAL